MGDTLEIFGKEFTNVAGFKAKDENGNTLIYTRGGSGGGTPAISIVDTTDSHGGTVREITALDISDTTAIASVVQSPYWFYTANGVKTQGTASGGGSPSSTAHTVYFEFSDNTNTTLTIYYDDAFTGGAITATTPTSYGNKTVTLAQLDGVTWYDRTNSWELVNEGRYTLNDSYGYYFWIPDMASIVPTVGSVWRITIDSTSYECTAKQITGFGDAINGVIIGNEKYIGQTDDGSDAPFCFYNYTNQAWTGDTSLDVMTLTEHYIKIERQNT